MNNMEVIDCTEIFKFKIMCELFELNHSINSIYNGFQIHIFDEKKKEICDVVCHYGSYGGNDGLLEGMGGPYAQEDGDSVTGYLTAKDAFTSLIKYLDK